MRALLAAVLIATAVFADDDGVPADDPGVPPFQCAPDSQCSAPSCAPDPLSGCECTCEADDAGIPPR